jgi:hypothetical protein
MMTQEQMERAGYVFRIHEGRHTESIEIVNPDGWEYSVYEWGMEEDPPLWERALRAANRDYQIRDMAQQAGLSEWIKSGYDEDLYDSLLEQTGNV